MVWCSIKVFIEVYSRYMYINLDEIRHHKQSNHVKGGFEQMIKKKNITILETSSSIIIQQYITKNIQVFTDLSRCTINSDLITSKAFQTITIKKPKQLESGYMNTIQQFTFAFRNQLTLRQISDQKCQSYYFSQLIPSSLQNPKTYLVQVKACRIVQEVGQLDQQGQIKKISSFSFSKQSEKILTTGTILLQVYRTDKVQQSSKSELEIKLPEAQKNCIEQKHQPIYLIITNKYLEATSETIYSKDRCLRLLGWLKNQSKKIFKYISSIVKVLQSFQTLPQYEHYDLRLTISACI
ncbi:unnamed protein product (macronuclear) [Paramecium tetraurelia]|uniref:Macroglobulin domain-containing protein n=1 Tax=Paramecium tetraurelia TaxID=5888 RepID=A0D029_PARTE|nr:uncharacterized protein GSPATT00039144001 [Paramecium tetraurelia]CAK76396.1 unnamed protein product [Paramecium tetraurelia]|eukprot:XP_001443793.1 hypothetical protein (macronuclear) [Paramecium tetraurelia strain d4-2]